MQAQEEFCHCEGRSDEEIYETKEIATPSGLAMTARKILARLQSF
jgi:hypothetical protein